MSRICRSTRIAITSCDKTGPYCGHDKRVRPSRQYKRAGVTQGRAGPLNAER